MGSSARHWLFFLPAGLLLFGGWAYAGTVTISGIAKDRHSYQPVGGAQVELVNQADTTDRYRTQSDVNGFWSSTIELTSVRPDEGVPTTVLVLPNYPNPFNPSTTIRFALPTAGRVRLSIYNILGQELGTREADLARGEYKLDWSARGAAGVLFYSLEWQGTTITRKMVQLDGGEGSGLGEMIPVGGMSAVSARPSPGPPVYLCIASRLDYEPESTEVALTSGTMTVDFSMETVHDRAFVIDLHNDVIEKVMDGYSLGPLHTSEHSDLPRFHKGGYDAQLFAIWADPSAYASAPYARAMAMIDAFEKEIAANVDTFAQARSSTDLTDLSSAGIFGGLLGVEGGHAIENDLSKLEAFYQRGVRCMTITWNNSTSWAISAQDPLSASQGLSPFGRQVIQTMDSLGMIIDVSHVGVQTIKDILTVTKNPIIASHSGARALRNHYRNLTDEQILSIANSGGVIGVVFYPLFLSSTNYATLDTVVKHIDYIRNLAGIDHVALGSDYDGMSPAPFGLEDASHLPALTLRLLERGYSREDVRKVLGGNFLRVARTVCH
jgi:membrane dipeptidase